MSKGTECTVDVTDFFRSENREEYRKRYLTIEGIKDMSLLNSGKLAFKVSHDGGLSVFLIILIVIISFFSLLICVLCIILAILCIYLQYLKRPRKIKPNKVSAINIFGSCFVQNGGRIEIYCNVDI
jgi:hypothetical protein